MDSYDVVVVGAGPAGLAVARRAADSAARVGVNGAHVRSCRLPAGGRRRSTPMDNYDVVVVGAGPAGLAAARRAADDGACVAVDGRPHVWRRQLPCRPGMEIRADG